MTLQTLRPRTACLVALASLASFSGACYPRSFGLSATEQATESAQSVAGADVRLRGEWVLRAFTPERPLEPTLGAMLAYQIGNLVVRFDGNHMEADSTGLHVDRRYQLSQAMGDSFRLTVFDEQGVPFEANCVFADARTLRIQSTTAPWRGVGTISRAGP